VFAAIGLAACGVASAALQATDAPLSVWAGVYSSAQAERGHGQYASHCAACHGEVLTGTSGVPPLTGKLFLYNWDGLPLQALFDRIQTTMPMDKPGSLRRTSAADLTAYVLAANGIPAGSAELPDDAQALQEIRLDAKRPAP
jgi:cytochrome c